MKPPSRDSPVKPLQRRAAGGFALMQFIVLGCLIAVMSTVLAGINAESRRMITRGSDLATMLSLRNHFLYAKYNFLPWLTLMRHAGIAEIANCLASDIAVSHGAVRHCATPQPASDLAYADSELVRLAEGQPLISIPLLDGLGLPLAGTADNPVYFTNHGLRCGAGFGSATDAKCVFEATGYYVRENLTGHPGNVTFILRLRHNPRLPLFGRTRLRPVYDTLEVWDQYTACGCQEVEVPRCNEVFNAATQTYSPAPMGQVSAIRLLGPRKVVCRRHLDRMCPVNQYVEGFSREGMMRCLPFPGP